MYLDISAVIQFTALNVMRYITYIVYHLRSQFYRNARDDHRWR